MRNKLESAIVYAATGWRIVPCHSVKNGKCTCRKQNCSKPGKHPRLKQWPNVATFDVETIRAWWTQWPDANVGVATGERSGIIVFDFDGKDGELSLKELVERDSSILETRVHRSGSGGTHLFFRSLGTQVRNAVRRIPGMDVRADGGMIILPPSNHVSGKCYSVVSALSIAALPASLHSLLVCHKEDDDHKESNESEEIKRMKQEKEGGREARKIAPKKQTIPREISEQIEWECGWGVETNLRRIIDAAQKSLRRMAD